MTALAPFGERAWRFPLPASGDRGALLAALRALEGVVDVVLAEEQGAVVLGERTPADAVVPAVTRALAAAPRLARATPGATHVIHVAYDGDDLAPLADRLGLSSEALVALHSGPEYDVAIIGFMPGFAYLRGLDPRLVVPRRDSPRTRVPARSVAIAAGYTGVYPFASPGGWHLLGEAIGFTPFDKSGAALAVGDRVRFEAIARGAAGAEAEPVAAQPLVPMTQGAWLEVRAARGPALLMDGGRIGRMHEGVPHGGPMVRDALARANAAVGNLGGACGIELYGGLELVARDGRVLVADDRHAARVLEDGEALAVGLEGERVRYVAVAGGFDVPQVLGGRGTMLAARLGGLEGRALKRGDRLPLSPIPTHAPAPAPMPAPAPALLTALIDVIAGPDADPAELHDLTFTIAPASDRTGTRLEGPLSPLRSARDRRSLPMVRGAIERTPSGLIVLGPDHPTTGGYPVIAVLCEAAMDRFFACPIGQRVRLRVRT